MACFAITKYLLFLFNFVFWLAGCAVLGVGIWLAVDPSIIDSVAVLDTFSFYAGAYVLIVAGAITLVVGFFGCCGAIKESTCLLGTYFGLLFVILAIEVGIGIWAFVSYDSIDAAIVDAMSILDTTEYTETNSLCATQQNLKCCGTVNNCTDWNNNAGGSLKCGCNPLTEPLGTCALATELGCNRDSTATTDYVYTLPCSTALSFFISDNLVLIGAIGLAIGLIEIFGMVVAICLCRSIKKRD